MSVKVPIEQLAEVMGEYPYAFLLCQGDHRPHVLAVKPVLDGDNLVIGRIGATATRLATANPAVTLAFAPHDPHGQSLLVDATAIQVGDGILLARPESAVRHRPA